MKYTTIHFFLSKNEEYVKDLLAVNLGEIGFDSFSYTESGMDAFIPSENLDKQKLNVLIAEFGFNGNITFLEENNEDKNWNEEWEKNFFQPIIIDNECVVHSSFHKDVPACKFDIVINPKMSFGTGHHETTSLMISEILKMNLYEKEVLDMGCGTSILAILAAKRGAKKITAIDIDEWCVENSKENILLNNAENVNIFLGGAELIENQTFDIILANINRNILLNDIPRYSKSLARHGELYLSGFYKEDIPILEEKLREYGLENSEYQLKNNWAMIKAVKKN